jgi:hypothetical protein
MRTHINERYDSLNDDETFYKNASNAKCENKCKKPILSGDQDGLGDDVLGTGQGTQASRAQP